MIATRPTTQSPSLLVFSDDWGRHPSSCQHLVRCLLPTHAVAWVNTIGTRAPKLDRETLRRGLEKLRAWRPSASHSLPAANLEPLAAGPRVLQPRMWPWFTRSCDRRLNRRLLETQLAAAIDSLPRPIVALTTLPITADLVGRLPVDGWLYYCVDDFREWPGLDGRTLGRMEAELVPKVDQIITVSETLRDRIAELGRDSALLTHGVDLEFWQSADSVEQSPAENDSAAPVLFFGVIDRRMDVEFLQQLSAAVPDRRIQLVGPQQNPDPALRALPNVELRPAVPFHSLPALARAAAALIMPYADLPVTRAMQPLKLKEYLATGKPVIVRDLPSTRDWCDALDLARTPDQFAQLVVQRLAEGLPNAQSHARKRLQQESWQAKSQQLLHHLQTSLPIASDSGVKVRE